MKDPEDEWCDLHVEVSEVEEGGGQRFVRAYRRADPSPDCFDLDTLTDGQTVQLRDPAGLGLRIVLCLDDDHEGPVLRFLARMKARENRSEDIRSPLAALLAGGFVRPQPDLAVAAEGGAIVAMAYMARDIRIDDITGVPRLTFGPVEALGLPEVSVVIAPDAAELLGRVLGAAFPSGMKERCGGCHRCRPAVHVEAR